MNWYLAAAATLTFLVGLVHSILGEKLIFRRLRQGGVVPKKGGGLLGEGHIRILWATWHIVTIFGWCIAVLLLWSSYPHAQPALPGIIWQAIIIAMLASAALVGIATKARHPGWVGLLGVAVLVWLGHFG